MKREIKFRVWDSHLKTYIHQAHIYHEFIRYLNDDSGRYIIEQYTGFKDKNGKEIYEGDIVNTWYGKAEVIWQSHSGEWLCKTFKEGRGYLDIDYSKAQDFKLIGNIH